jgi:sec-independent protein translocase protein TatC
MAKENDGVSRMSFWGHLEELRKRLVASAIAVGVGFIVCFQYSEAILDILLWPMRRKMDITSSYPFFAVRVNETAPKLHFTTATEPFWSHLKIAFVSGIIVAVPVIMYQVWQFLKPGLLKKERIYARFFVVFSTFFFAVGVLFCLFLLLPFAVTFLLEYKTQQLVPILTIGQYVDFVLKFLLASGAIFELPLVIVLLTRMGIMTPQWLAKQRKYAFLLAFVAGAIITPTQDVFNMTLMSIPIYLLYEIGVLASRILGKTRTSDSTDLEASE